MLPAYALDVCPPPLYCILHPWYNVACPHTHQHLIYSGHVSWHVSGMLKHTKTCLHGLVTCPPCLDIHFDTPGS